MERPGGIGFAAVSGIFLIFAFIAEYIVVDPGAPYYATALAGLTAISYALFFILAVALRYGDLRLFFTLPALFLFAGFASLRIFHLRFRWSFGNTRGSLGIAFVCVQLAAGFHYWPISPIQFGLMMIGPMYGLTNLAINLREELPSRRGRARASPCHHDMLGISRLHSVTHSRFDHPPASHRTCNCLAQRKRDFRVEGRQTVLEQ
jgi:hypothetical protein